MNVYYMNGLFKFPTILNKSVTIWNLERPKNSVCKKSNLFKFNVREVIKLEKGQRLGRRKTFQTSYVTILEYFRFYFLFFFLLEIKKGNVSTTGAEKQISKS